MTNANVSRTASAAAAVLATLLVAAPALAAASDPVADAAAAPDGASDAAAPALTASGTAVVASQYRWRGLARSNNQPVIQASVLVSHKSGFYIAAWGSSAQSGPAVNIGGTELDIYGGYTRALGNSGFTVDGGVYGYVFPGASANNFAEFYVSLSKTLGPVVAKAGVDYAPRQKDFRLIAVPHHDNTYVYAELSTAIPHTPLTVHSHLGHTGGALDYLHAYLDYAAGVSASWKKLTFDVSGVGTNVKRDEADASTGRTGFSLFTYGNAAQTYRAAKPVVVFSLLANF